MPSIGLLAYNVVPFDRTSSQTTPTNKRLLFIYRKKGCCSLFNRLMNDRDSFGLLKISSLMGSRLIAEQLLYSFFIFLFLKENNMNPATISND